ncbi:MAG: hypothetical protein ACTSQZ_04975 [Candidatus Thorarchaeota archaeon]
MKKTEIAGFLIFFTCLIVWAYQEGKEDCICEQQKTIRQYDYTGNIQGDTICKPEERLSGGKYLRN